MRRLTVLLGLMLALGAVAALGYRWAQEPSRYSRSQPQVSDGWRGSEPRAGGWRGERSTPVRRGEGNRSVNGLRLFEIVIDTLNVFVGGVGIWLAITGVRMHRSASRQLSARSDL